MSEMIQLVPFDEQLLAIIWQLGFSQDQPEWKEWDAPYFDDYHRFESAEAFIQSDIATFLQENARCIIYQDQPVGAVTYYWENKQTRWLNIGITIYQSLHWGQQIGTRCLTLWIDEIFNMMEDLEHIGLTTWSGNQRMMRAAENIGMQQEACFRKVRYYQGTYYDSVSYGILREEWEAINGINRY